MTMNSLPMLIAVAPNGARRTKKDHPKLPITPVELARTASACVKAGAAMMHLHVRDSAGRHTLDLGRYLSAVREVEAAVGDTMLLQVTSEAAGIYEADRQIDLMERLAPHCLSCGLREFVKDRQWFVRAERFFFRLYRAGILIQYILYSPEDVSWYEQLCRLGVLPGESHFLLFVLGRYTDKICEQYGLTDYVKSLERKSRWMACAFGRNEYSVMKQAADLGGHARVGFENNLLLPNGSLAADNAELVRITAETVRQAGRPPGNKKFAETLF
ncbi:MAG: 3-keto-5-aminohexanoate cleavage protein [Deltaproteobacteria bacterium]|nr:3-keto-5-aminohexanoate cleavage protein [Deltaproteobacteria bacterium]